MFGLKPVCEKCGTKESNIWQRDEQDQIVCCECQTGAVRWVVTGQWEGNYFKTHQYWLCLTCIWGFIVPLSYITWCV